MCHLACRGGLLASSLTASCLWLWNASQAALAGVFIYVIGIPTATFMSIRRSQQRKKLQDPRVRKKFGMLYDGYQEQWCWWEGKGCVPCYRTLRRCVDLCQSR